MALTIGYAAQLGQGNMSKGEGLMIKILTIVVAIKIEIQFQEIYWDKFFFKYWLKHHKIIVYANLPLQKSNKLLEIKYFVPGAKNEDIVSNFVIEEIVV